MATVPDTHADLLAHTNAAFVTVGPDGYPQVTFVHVNLEAGRIHTSVNDHRQKYKNLAANPHAAVFAVDPENPYRTIEVRADAELVADPGKEWTRQFLPGFDVDAIDGDAARYHVVLTPVKVNTLTPGAW